MDHLEPDRALETGERRSLSNPVPPIRLNLLGHQFVFWVIVMPGGQRRLMVGLFRRAAMSNVLRDHGRAERVVVGSAVAKQWVV